MSQDKITLSRAVLEALVDPKIRPYIDSEQGYCVHCDATWQGFHTTPDEYNHTPSCPVRLAQEALATGFTITDCVFTRIRRPDDPEI